MRCFIAIDLPQEIHAALARLQAEFRAALGRHDADARWTRPEGIHLTLKFLGHVPEPEVAAVTESLAALGAFDKFAIEVGGLGFFPGPRRPRVFWVGVEAPPALQTLVSGVEAAMEKLGFAPEQRDFTPHLTLARFRTPRPQPALEKLVAERANLSLGKFEVSEFFLFESKLSPHGAEYRKVARFPRAPA
ncbi:MAG TPA: RNA 2',3'-cyclic phosphodiesterase [Terriglobia bacterium]|nr:RNA 2',3'-cyclic phosphodiesterase [Terriglobia bacterium]